MTSDKWFIDVPLLDEFQKVVIQKPLTENMVVVGIAGSGKTLLALHQIRRIRTMNSGVAVRFFFIVFTRSLCNFVKAASKNIKAEFTPTTLADKVMTYSEWSRNAYEADFILVDEAQDFSEDQISMLLDKKQVALQCYGDDDQQIFETNIHSKQPTISMDRISLLLRTTKIPLQINRRTPKPIAAFAEYLLPSRGFLAFCEKDSLQKPLIKKCNDRDSEIEWIGDQINSFGLDDVAILVPTNKEAVYAEKILQGKGLKPELYKDADGQIRKGEGIKFDTTNPKVITFSNCKGLEFDVVFIPFCNNHGTMAGDPKYKTMLFVGMTRASKGLYLTHSGVLHNFLSQIPRYLYNEQ